MQKTIVTSEPATVTSDLHEIAANLTGDHQRDYDMLCEIARKGQLAAHLLALIDKDAS